MSDAQRVPMFEFVQCTILSLAPQMCHCVAEKPIKRCSCGSNMTKPPSDFLYIRATAKTGLIKTPLCQLTCITHTQDVKRTDTPLMMEAPVYYMIYTLS